MTSWRDEAACVGTDPDTFFPGYSSEPPGVWTNQQKQAAIETTAKARAICRTCPVELDCLNYVLQTVKTASIDHGIWGGTTPQQRQHIRTARVVA